LYGDFQGSPSKDELIELLKVGGGEILSSVPQSDPKMNKRSLSIEFQTTKILVNEQIVNKQKGMQILTQTGITPMNYMWILDSVSAYKLIDESSYRIVDRHMFETQNSMAI
jgi:hypothetical protein